MNRNRSRILVVLAGAVLLTAFAASWIDKLLRPEELSVVKITGQKLTLEATGYGSIEEKSKNGLYISLPTKIKEVYVKPGQRVKKGDVLATVDLNATKVALNLSVAGLIEGVNNIDQTYNITDYAGLSGLRASQVAEEMEKIPENIVAKYDALVEKVNVQPDGFTNPYTPIFVLSDISKIQVAVSIEEAAAANVKVGQSAVISGKGLTRDYRARVTEIAASATQEVSLTLTQSKVKVILEVLDPDDHLKLGLTAKATIALEDLDQAIVIPYEAVFQENDQDFVYVVENGRAVKREVEIGESFDSGMLITAGLHAGDRLVLEPNSVSAEGVLVKERVS